MRVKHKNSEKHKLDPYIPLEHWHKMYLPNAKYLNYDFYDVGNIVDVYKINEKTGELMFLKSEFEEYATKIVAAKPKEYLIKPLKEGRLDENLMPKHSYSESSFFNRLKYKLVQIIKPKAKPITIPFSRYERVSIIIGISAIIIPTIISLILFVIDKKI